MAGNIEKQLVANFNELGDLLIKGSYKEAWTVAGATQRMLKTDEVLQVPASVLDEMKSAIKSYYRLNEELNAVSKKLYANGKKMQEIVG